MVAGLTTTAPLEDGLTEAGAAAGAVTTAPGFSGGLGADFEILSSTALGLPALENFGSAATGLAVGGAAGLFSGFVLSADDSASAFGFTGGVGAVALLASGAVGPMRAMALGPADFSGSLRVSIVAFVSLLGAGVFGDWPRPGFQVACGLLIGVGLPGTESHQHRWKKSCGLSPPASIASLFRRSSSAQSCADLAGFAFASCASAEGTRGGAVRAATIKNRQKTFISSARKRTGSSMKLTLRPDKKQGVVRSSLIARLVGAEKRNQAKGTCKVV